MSPLNVELIGQIGGNTNAVAVQGKYAYMGVGPRMVVLDVTNPSEPVAAGQSVVMPGVVQGIALSGFHAYVVDSAGLHIVGISNPADPVEVGSYDTFGSARGIAVAGSYAYVVDAAGLYIINVSNPARPVVIGTYDTPAPAVGVAAAGSYVYVAESSYWDGSRWVGGGLRIIDVANPARPNLARFYDTLGSTWSVTIAGNYAYVAAGSAGLHILDLSNPTAPALAGVYDVPGNARSVAVVGNYAYVAASAAGLHVVDVSDPANPTEVSSFEMTGLAQGLAVASQFAYVAAGPAGLRIIDVGNPTSTGELGAFISPVSTLDVAASGNFAYVADAEGLFVIDVSRPAKPAVVSFQATPGIPRRVVIAGHYAYLAEGSYWNGSEWIGGGLRIVDVAIPTSPRLVGFYDTPADPRDLAVVGTNAYVAAGSAGLLIIDVADPARSTLVGFYESPGEVWSLAVAGTNVYLAGDTDRLNVVDVTDVTAPTEIRNLDEAFSDIRRITVAGNYAYLARGGSVLIYSVSSPASPSYRFGFSIRPGVASDIAVAGNYAYVAAGVSGLRVINVTNPTYPSLAGYYDTPGDARGVAVANDLAYVADAGSGIFILRYRTGASPMPTGTPTATPTPAGAWTTPTPTATPIPVGTPRPASLSILPSSSIVGVGSIFTLTVQLDAGTEPFDAAEVHLNFDRDVLRVVDPLTGLEASAIADGELGAAVGNQVDNTAGQIDYAWVSTGAAASGTKVLARVPLKALAVQAGTQVRFAFTPVRMTDVQNSARTPSSVLGPTSDATVQVVEGTVVVKLAFPSQRGTPPNARYVVSPTLTLLQPGTTTAAGIYTATTDATGVFTATGVLPGTYDVQVKVPSALALKKANVAVGGLTVVDLTSRPLQFGDADDNGVVNISDFTLWKRALFGSCGQTKYDTRVDFDANCVVNITDFTLWKQNIFKTSPVIVTQTVASALKGPAGDPATGVQTHLSGPVALRIQPPSSNVPLNGPFTLTVQIDAGTEPFDSAEVHVDFDRNVLRVVDPATGLAAAAIVDGELGAAAGNQADNLTGQIDYAWVSTGAAASGTKVLARIPFKAIASASSSPVTFALTPMRLTDVQNSSRTPASVLGPHEDAVVTVGAEAAATSTSTATPTPPPTVTATPAGTAMPTPTAASTATPTSLATATPTATGTPGAPTLTPMPSATATVPPGQPTFTPTPSPSATPTATATFLAGQPTSTPTATGTPAPTATALAGVTIDVPISAGWNNIALPAARTVPLTASGLIAELESRGVQVEHVARWYDGRWQSYLKTFPVPANDFPIELGRGYFVRSRNYGTWRVSGNLLR